MTVVAGSLDSFVEAYEEARGWGYPAPLENFLPPPDHPLRRAVLLELVRIDLEHGWLAGRPTPVDAYRRRFPELFADPAAVREVLFEDYRLREEVGRRIGSTTTGGEVDLTAPLAIGSSFAGFHLLAELGQGSFGRVFLVEQPGLAGRPVVLKIATDLFHESQALAQLQHTHVVPIYSAHRQGDRQALCMPFLGVLTLADLIDAFAARGLPGSGAEWLTLSETLCQRRRDQIAIDLPAVTCPQNHPLRTASHVAAVLWVGECLADGLAHAHQRGILHRDVKPANVLLTDDGTPMLLDFNLAQDARDPRAPTGGTLAYMAPEQLASFLGQDGRVDPRSDVYSLGLVLYELLTGSAPWGVVTGSALDVASDLMRQRSAEPPSIGNRCAAASPGVQAILRGCLHPDPERRYPSAAALRDDLARQRQNQPLLHVREPLLERAVKFARRHPRLVPLLGTTSLALLALLLVWQLVARSREVARHSARESLARLAEEVPQAELEARLAGPGDPAALDRAERRCLAASELANDRGLTNHLALLSAEECATYNRLLGELLLNRARLRLLAGELGQALELNEAASRFLRDSRVALTQRADVLRALGRPLDAALAERQAAGQPGPTPTERSLAAAQLRGQGRWREALAQIEAALRDEPSDFRLWFDLGLCRQRVEDHTGALAAFDTCLALAPRATLARFLRGGCHLRQGAYTKALEDLDRVVAERPDLIEARLNRALALAGLGRFREAEADLSAVIAADAGLTRAYFLRAELRQRLGDKAAAQSDRAEGLRREPGDALSWVARALARQQAEPEAALADLDRALALDPHSAPALQNRAHVLAEKLKRPADAADALARLLESRPGDLEARAARAVCLARATRRDEALAEARRCLAAPAGAAVLHRVGCVFALTMRDNPRRRREALCCLTRAVQMGVSPAAMAADPDLASLRDDDDFRALLTRPVPEGTMP